MITLSIKLEEDSMVTKRRYNLPAIKGTKRRWSNVKGKAKLELGVIV